MELWFTERQTPHQDFSLRVERTLYREKTPYQDLAVLETAQWGRMLVLDGYIQTTVGDEFVYHEMIAHVPLCTHPRPRTVAVIGGGDGGAVREVLKHPSVQKAVLVEIDGRVVEAARTYLPELSSALADPRVEVRIEDGIAHLAQRRAEYDCILVDSTDPVGPAVGLFSSEFYASVYRALTEEGLFVAQTESPFFNRDLIQQVFAAVSQIFPVARLYWATVPTYPGVFWTFTLGSKRYDPLAVVSEELDRRLTFPTRYYSSAIHRASFVLPPFVEELIRAGKMGTTSSPRNGGGAR